MSHIKHSQVLLTCLAVTLGACGDREVFDAVPDISSAPDGRDAWPDLAPATLFKTREIRNEAAGQESAAEAERLAERVAQLRRRAAALRRPILTSQERSELERGVGPL